MTSKKIYDAISHDYLKVKTQREFYNDSVDKYIINHPAYKSFRRVLDIGSGDGARISKIFDKNILITAVEESREMSKLLRANSRFERVLEIKAEELDSFGLQPIFDLITMQWNVMGHIHDHPKVLGYCLKILKKGGRLIFDVNNPLNFRQYGALSVLKNFHYFYIFPRRERRFFKWNFGEISTEVGYSPPSYFVSLLKDIGFVNIQQTYLDYDTGSTVKFFNGQLLLDSKKP